MILKAKEVLGNASLQKVSATDKGPQQALIWKEMPENKINYKNVLSTSG